MKIFKEFSFEAAHRLPNVPDGHKCARLHGHSFKVKITVSGPVGEDTGWVMTSPLLRRPLNRSDRQLDHRYLNEIEGLENPTSENIVRWIWRRLRPGLPEL